MNDLCLLILLGVALLAAFAMGFALGRLTAPVVKIDLDQFIKASERQSAPAPVPPEDVNQA